MAFLDPFFDTAFGFMLQWQPVWAIALLSFLISLIIVLIYKWMTDQKEMKQLKEQLKEYQKKIKEAKNDPAKALSIQKEMMAVNMKYMGKSMKPTLITFLPIILIFGWMSAHFAYSPIMPGEEFTLTANMEKEAEGNVSIIVPEGLEVIENKTTTEIANNAAVFKLKGEEGEYFATLETAGEKQDKKIIVTKERKYAPVIESYKSDIFKTIELGNKPLKIIWKLSWIWVYIIFAIVFSMALRKVLKVY